MCAALPFLSLLLQPDRVERYLVVHSQILLKSMSHDCHT
jgi:hypothetical protein